MPWRFWQMLGLARLKNRIFKLSTEIRKMGNLGKTKMPKFRKPTKHIRFHNFHHFCFGTSRHHLANWESQICLEPKTGARTSFVGASSQEKTLSLIVGERLLKCGGSDTDALFFLDYTLIDEQDDSRHIDELL